MSRDVGQQIAVVVVLMSLSLWVLPTSALAIDVGDKAPDFVMHSTVGETVRLSEYQGQKTVVIFFFPAAFTSVWTQEALAFQLDLPKYESLDTQVLGVSTDVVGALQAFAEKLSLTYPLLSDFARETVQKYGMMVDDPYSASFRLAQRAYVIIDQQGIIRYQWSWKILTMRSTLRRFSPPSRKSWLEFSNLHAEKNICPDGGRNG
jgi:peroxiredoxin